jgi:uncharacterized membrane protein YvbJ
MPDLCPHCGNSVSDEMKYCPECGGSLKSQGPRDSGIKPIIAKIKRIPSSDILTIAGICFFIIVICLVMVPTKTITYSIDVAYADNETYYEKEPYIIPESYQEQVAYQSTDRYTDIVPVPTSVPYQDKEYSYQVYNATDGYYSSVPTDCVCSGNRYLSDQTGVYDTLCIQLTCQIATTVTKYRTETQQKVIQKERPVTKYQTVTKYRNVTQYQDVAKTRTVLKTRIEERQIEANWLFGFKTPYSLHLPHISGGT